jgi:hypothetical protein
MADRPMFTEACLAPSMQRATRRETLTLFNHFGGGHANAEAVFSLCNDPHYWHADYNTLEKPRHLLIC